MVMPAVLPRYTVDMLDALPDYPGVRYELVDGLLLVTPAAGSLHAGITARLIASLVAGIPEDYAYVAPPGEVRVGRFTSLVPDILVYPSRFPLGTAWKDITEWLLAIEIVSPSSAVYDRDHKRRAYLALGVREYWVVDPMRRSIEVWRPGDAAPRIESVRFEYVTPDGGHRVSIDVERLFRDVIGSDFE